MTSLTIRARNIEDDPRILAILNGIAPEFPPKSLEKYRHRLSNTPEGVPFEVSVAGDGDLICGTAIIVQKFWTDAKTSYYIDIAVDRAHRRRGIGSRLYEHLLDKAKEFGAVRLTTHFLESIPEGERFVTRRGFERTGRVNRLSRLDVHHANLEGYEGIEDRITREGLRIATLADIGPDDEAFLKQLYEADVRMTRDVPSSEPITSIPYDTWLKDVKEAPNLSPESIWIALKDRQPVGLAVLAVDGRNAWNGFTGVDRPYRGKGVARALKKCTIDWSRRNGVDFIYTANDIDNARMLAVNVRLGYQPLPNQVEVTKELS